MGQAKRKAERRKTAMELAIAHTEALRNLNLYELRLWLEKSLGKKAFDATDRVVLAGAHKARIHAVLNDKFVFTADERLVSELWLKGNGFTTEL